MCDELVFVTIELRENAAMGSGTALSEQHSCVVIFFIVSRSFSCLLASSAGLYLKRQNVGISYM